MLPVVKNINLKILDVMKEFINFKWHAILSSVLKNLTASG